MIPPNIQIQGIRRRTAQGKVMNFSDRKRCIALDFTIHNLLNCSNIIPSTRIRFFIAELLHSSSVLSEPPAKSGSPPSHFATDSSNLQMYIHLVLTSWCLSLSRKVGVRPTPRHPVPQQHKAPRECSIELHRAPAGCQTKDKQKLLG